MPAQRTGVSTLRQLLRALCKLRLNFPALLTNPDIPVEISAAVGALVLACLASDFDDPNAGEITN
jgi:hypothetical protein